MERVGQVLSSPTICYGSKEMACTDRAFNQIYRMGELPREEEESQQDTEFAVG